MWATSFIMYPEMHMREKILLQILAFVFLVLPLKGFSASTLEINELGFLSVNSAITPATYDYLKQHFESLPKSTLIILKLNTPGGLVSTTKDIITMAAREKRPFVVWITPEGASAASAGSIIASAAHYIFMSPGTNMGAATPVGLGEDIKESDGRKKAMNDLTAMVRSLSVSRGRPAEAFEKMITEAESYTSSESLKLGIIDGIVSNQNEMLAKLNSKMVIIDGVETQLVVKNVLSKNYEPTLGQRILEVIANPSTAYVLFLIGVALIYFELQAPGGYIAGTLGVCLLILAGIAFQVLPLDWGSMGLIVAGIFLLVLELYVVSYGLLGLAGITAFVMGSLFLFHGDSGFISVQYNVILSALAGVLITIGILIWFLWKEKQKHKAGKNFFLPVGASGTILSKINDQEYQVKVRGEIWRAFTDEKFQINDQVHVSEVDANKLTIRIKRNS